MLERAAYWSVRAGSVLHLRLDTSEGGLGLTSADAAALTQSRATASIVALWLGVLLVVVIGSRTTAVLGTGMLAVAYLALGLVPGDAMLVPFLMIGAGLGIAKSAFFVLAAQATLGRERGFGSWVQLFLLLHIAVNIGGFLGPVVLGVSRDAWSSLPAAFGVSAIIAALVSLGLAVIPAPPRLPAVAPVSSRNLGAVFVFFALVLGYQVANDLAFVDGLAAINLIVVVPLCLLTAFAHGHVERVGALSVIGVGLGLTAIVAIAGLDNALGMVLLSVAEVLTLALVLGRLALGRSPGLAALMVVLWTTTERLGGVALSDTEPSSLLRTTAGLWCLLGGLALVIWGPRLQALLQVSHDASTPTTAP